MAMEGIGQRMRYFVRVSKYIEGGGTMMEVECDHFEIGPRGELEAIKDSYTRQRSITIHQDHWFAYCPMSEIGKTVFGVHRGAEPWITIND